MSLGADSLERLREAAELGKERAAQSVGQSCSLGVQDGASLEGQLLKANCSFVVWGGPALDRTS